MRNEILLMTDDVVEIQLSQYDKTTIFDREDLDIVESYSNWAAKPIKKYKGKFQAVHTRRISDKKCEHIILHRLIMEAPKGMQVDHINGDSLDNRKSNLRLCTDSQNKGNRGLNSNNTSGYMGVCKYKDRWKVQVCHENKTYYLGLFDDKDEAARAYNKKKLELFGEFARINNVD